MWSPKYFNNFVIRFYYIFVIIDLLKIIEWKKKLLSLFFIFYIIMFWKIYLFISYSVINY